jgi:hypothetical protein
MWPRLPLALDLHAHVRPVWAKVIESGEKLLFRRPSAAGIIVFTEDDDEESARSRLEEFLAAMEQDQPEGFDEIYASHTFHEITT